MLLNFYFKYFKVHFKLDEKLGKDDLVFSSSEIMFQFCPDICTEPAASILKKDTPNDKDSHFSKINF